MIDTQPADTDVGAHLYPEDRRRWYALHAARLVLGADQLPINYIELAAYVLTGDYVDPEVEQLRTDLRAITEERDRYQRLARTEADKATAARTESARLRRDQIHVTESPV